MLRAVLTLRSSGNKDRCPLKCGKSKEGNQVSILLGESWPIRTSFTSSYNLNNQTLATFSGRLALYFYG